MTDRIDCQICGDRGVIADSAKPAFMTADSARVVDGKQYWMYCFACSHAMEGINKRRKKHRCEPLELPCHEA